MRNVLICLFLTPAAQAQEALTTSNFQSYTEGRIFAFAYPGENPYGTEHYLEDRQVIWAAADGTCLRGKWFEADGQICFRYRDWPSLNCSYFFTHEDGMLVVPGENDDRTHVASLTQTMLNNQCDPGMS